MMSFLKDKLKITLRCLGKAASISNMLNSANTSGRGPACLSENDNNGYHCTFLLNDLMYTSITNYIRARIAINDDELENSLGYIQPKTFVKGEYLLPIGQQFRFIFF